MIEHKILQVGSFDVNCIILSAGGKAWIVDPGSEADRILAALSEQTLEPVAILLTHAHFDHIGGIPGILKAFPNLPVLAGREDVAIFDHPFNQYPPDYPPVARPRTLRPIVDATLLPPGCRVIETPGHTPGGVCYHLTEDALLLSGDTLFCGSAGRTDLPGGHAATLLASLAKLASLPENTVVIPGHGMTTSIGREKASNPFLA